MPCAKGGVSNQLCGWIRAILLFTGRITESQIIKDSKILEQQSVFSDNDGSPEKRFANVFDQGFRNSLDASLDDQTCIQPTYSKGGEQFKKGGYTVLSLCSCNTIWK